MSVRGVTVVEEEWLGRMGPRTLRKLGKVAEQPEPWYDAEKDAVVGLVGCRYGEKGWEVGVVEHQFAGHKEDDQRGLEAVVPGATRADGAKQFARLLLEGKVVTANSLAPGGKTGNGKNKGKKTIGGDGTTSIDNGIFSLVLPHLVAKPSSINKQWAKTLSRVVDIVGACDKAGASRKGLIAMWEYLAWVPQPLQAAVTAGWPFVHVRAKMDDATGVEVLQATLDTPALTRLQTTIASLYGTLPRSISISTTSPVAAASSNDRSSTASVSAKLERDRRVAAVRMAGRDESDGSDGDRCVGFAEDVIQQSKPTEQHGYEKSVHDEGCENTFLSARCSERPNAKKTKSGAFIKFIDFEMPSERAEEEILIGLNENRTRAPDTHDVIHLSDQASFLSLEVQVALNKTEESAEWKSPNASSAPPMSDQHGIVALYSVASSPSQPPTSTLPQNASTITTLESVHDEECLSEIDQPLKSSSESPVDPAKPSLIESGNDQSSDLEPNTFNLQDQTVRLPFKQLITVFVGCSLAIMLSFLDQTSGFPDTTSVVSTALPRISTDLNAADEASWVGTAYLLTSTAFQTLWGRFSDIWGRKICLLVSLVIFLIGNILCGFAHSISQLVVFRALAGVGGGGILTLVMVVISDVVSLRDRGKYQGLIGVNIAISSVLGPYLGGLFADTPSIGWRWCFYIAAPIGVVAFLMIYFLLPLKPVTGSFKAKMLQVDYIGTVLILVSTLLLLLPMNWGGTTYSWSSPIIVVMFCLAGVFVSVLVGVELWIERRGRLPIIPNRQTRFRREIWIAAGAAPLGSDHIELDKWASGQLVGEIQALHSSGICTLVGRCGTLAYTVANDVITNAPGDFDLDR
ncbi:hypothetical protein HDU93_009575, partial [Gonapodya sp. JEL0774]